MRLQAGTPGLSPTLPSWLSRLHDRSMNAAPRTLRARFTVSLAHVGLGLLAATGVAVWYLHGHATGAVAQAELKALEVAGARHLVDASHRIRELHRTLSASSPMDVQRLQAEVHKQLSELQRPADANGVAHKAAEPLRQSLRRVRDALAAAPATAQLDELRDSVDAVVAASTSHLEGALQARESALQRGARDAQVRAGLVVAMLGACLFFAWVAVRQWLGRRVFDRLDGLGRSPQARAQDGVRAEYDKSDEIAEAERVVSQCLSERRELSLARGRLEENQSRLRAIFDNTADSIIVLQNGCVVQVNPSAERMFALRGSLMIGMPAQALLPDIGMAELCSGITCETQILARDGRTIPVELSSSQIASEQQPLVVLVVRDATMRKEVEQQLIAARDAAEAARSEQATFLASMSHELRTPLNAILGYAQLMQMDKSVGGQQRFAVDTIRSSGTHLLALIDDLLDLAKNDAGALELVLAPLALHEFLQASADLLRVKAQESGIEFVCDVAPDVPLAVLADEKRLRQVLLNLLSNAVKFTDNGQVTLRVRLLDANEHRARVRFDVRDTGIGMTPRQLEAIFRPFVQVGDVRRRAAGAGLGLAISNQLVRLMGADLRVSSAVGRGTVFTFDLDLPLVSQQPGAAVSSIVGYQGRRRRVLVVDDLEVNRTLLGEILRPLGFDVEEARNGQEALASVQLHAPDLVITDMVMPVMGGAEATRHIRRLPGLQALPVIACSANRNAADTTVGTPEGPDCLLAKPIGRQQLLEEVASRLRLVWTLAGGRAAHHRVEPASVSARQSAA